MIFFIEKPVFREIRLRLREWEPFFGTFWNALCAKWKIFSCHKPILEKITSQIGVKVPSIASFILVDETKMTKIYNLY